MWFSVILLLDPPALLLAKNEENLFSPKMRKIYARNISRGPLGSSFHTPALLVSIGYAFIRVVESVTKCPTPSFENSESDEKIRLLLLVFLGI